MSKFTDLRKPDIHAHEILEMMIRTEKTYTNESLSAEIVEVFGEESTFHTCSGHGLDAYDIVQHLWMKGKFTGNPDAFVFESGNRCSH
ncbi:YecH family metal-binding protein [Pelagicoccus sp. SDUM812002]|uniref:YecH family metal-binding protein n=1 Tax=Pelagicoccus sp. SDUM812002 TaxID=3041266 RepID=UPI00280FB11A|nr:YecH family metal-binding protein [Pelagicoccus sp. SDUM812002]MDQ8184670.1 YecH family protein [Pelagicoccus sp. SDUM812002]